jgi:hypothetical protein
VTDVELSWGEWRRAAYEGVDRFVRAFARKRASAHGSDDGDLRAALWKNMLGALGEAAAAKALDRYWGCGDTRLDYGGDVGPYHVRTRALLSYDLTVYPSDPDDAAIFLIVPLAAPRFRVQGWLYGREAKQERYWQAPNGRWAYFVPVADLRALNGAPETLDPTRPF